MNLDWNSIRTFKGSQSNAFEELCAQLARAETPPDARFVRKGTPDAGVECFCQLQDDSEWGWQAKYFTASPTSTQWQQLDKSVKSALDKHTDLVRYYVCIPIDRPDARIEGQQSTMQRWETRVAKWKCWAQKWCMNVEFVWWGSSELLDRLSLPEHFGRVYFWFDTRYFDDSWFGDRLEQAIAAASARFTPELHVDVPIAHKFELLGRTESALNQIKLLARDIRRALSFVRYTSTPDESSSQIVDLAEVSDSVRLEQLLQAGEDALSAFSDLYFAPTDKSPLASAIGMVKAARNLAEETIESLHKVIQDDSSRVEGETQSPYLPSPIDRLRDSVVKLGFRLDNANFELCQAAEFADSNLMILEGMAGTGKTHLLCDSARLRTDSGAPTIFLMGHRFTTSEEPWTQVFQQLELHDLTVERFVGALEAVAEARNCRALLIVDALNEGLGHKVWPNHLSAFLKSLERSAWIAVVLSVRSTYWEIIPEEVRNNAVVVEHTGFTDDEYEAVARFSSHYELELPSVPILQPEFSNPLFLKMICEGLHSRGERRLPKGLQGVTEFFGFYLDTVNSSLAKALDYDPNQSLVQDALAKLAQELVTNRSRYLPRQRAQEIIDQLLPSRDFSRSLYRGLVIEGILLEDIDWRATNGREKVTSITYERFADHTIASNLLEIYLDADHPEAAFAIGGGLAFLEEEGVYTRDGLIEALCIQVPELIGRELFRLAPSLLECSNLGRAFRQSIIWRKLGAFSDDTWEVLHECASYEGDTAETLEVLLTIATVENHPFNAEMLDTVLRRWSMPERDSWWSTYLHHAYQSSGGVNRLVDWASGVSSDATLEERTVDLAGITLTWMLTTSNRFLRDRATKALVSLLSDRLDAAARLVGRFHDVDDPFVTERLYAVAYGVAMRSHDAAAVGNLASIVYERVFASGNPPAHILLRDYARGVIERAIHLGSTLQIDQELFRPPYKSEWPDIPDENTIEALMPDLSRDSDDSRELELARHQIEFSVMHDDFARYVIGTNFGRANWLSMRLEEAPWLSHTERIRNWKSKLSGQELKAWEEYEDRHNEGPITITLAVEGERGSSTQFVRINGKSRWVGIGSLTEADRRELDQAAERADEESKDRLFSALTKDHRTELESIFRKSSEDRPSFDLSQIQRYVLWRVFDLGWTIERFGHFDSQFVQNYQRDAAKPERIGKKYQWIAYHEVLAYIADHYQYRGMYGEDDSDRAYEGPWQERLRDIDPSYTIKRTPGDPSWGSHNPSWWASYDCVDWGEDLGYEAWAKRDGDFPAVEELLSVVRPEDETRWINAKAFLLWRQSHPADLEPDMVDRRELWLRITAFYLRAECAEDFMQWASCADTWGTWLHEPSGVQDFYLGEYGWSQAFRHIFKPFYGYSDWEEPGDGSPTSVRPASFQYTAEAGTFDCSIEESFSLRLPHHDFVAKLGLRWSGTGTNFCDSNGRRVAFDPTVHEDGPSGLLLREDYVRTYLSQNNLALVWIVQGEKDILGKGLDSVPHGWHSVTGAFLYTDGKPTGSLRHRFDAPGE
ncbi:MAG: NACHT domain-containing protein [Chloroflexi bacterium]|nr:NACHT domain-containing protein [Chloroflexota bacterium]